MHEAADTRVYTKLARFVSLIERQAKHATSTSIAHAALTRQLVDFFEMQTLAFVTAAIAIVGSVVMLVILAPAVSAVTAALLFFAGLAAMSHMRLSEFIAAGLHSRQEQRHALRPSLPDHWGPTNSAHRSLTAGSRWRGQCFHRIAPHTDEPRLDVRLQRRLSAGL